MSDKSTELSPKEIGDFLEMARKNGATIVGVGPSSNGQTPMQVIGEPKTKKKYTERKIHDYNQKSHAVNVYDIVYNRSMEHTIQLVTFDNNETIYYKPEDIINLAKILQTEQIKDKTTIDQEFIDHQQMAKELLSPSEEDDAIQVLDGLDHANFDLFPGNNAESIKMALHYIEVNNLKETPPWSMVWNLWKCLEAVNDKASNNGD